MIHQLGNPLRAGPARFGAGLEGVMLEMPD
jgi:hypothetical protein